MTRILLALAFLALPLAARAQSSDGRWGEGSWSGDDEYSDPEPRGSDPRDGYAERSDTESPPPDGDEDDSAGPSMADFHEGLDGYGRWVDTADYGVVWQPAAVGYFWHPYWDGRWVMTHSGWTWASAEPWGWATYHYGRWVYMSGTGWGWLPGRVWGPAWVAWRFGDGYAGWCPMGPHGSVVDDPHYWVFVNSRNFLEPVKHNTVPIAQVTFPRVRPLPIARPGPFAGPAPRVVENQTHVPVRAVPVFDVRTRMYPLTLPSGALPMYRPRTMPIVRSQPVQRYWGVPARGGASAKPASAQSTHPSGAPHATAAGSRSRH